MFGAYLRGYGLGNGNYDEIAIDQKLICKLESMLWIISIYDVTILIDIKCIILHILTSLQSRCSFQSLG